MGEVNQRAATKNAEAGDAFSRVDDGDQSALCREQDAIVPFDNCS